MAISPASLKKERQRNFLGKDFDSLRQNLLEYARLYYADRISDFSENSVGGLFLDMAAYVGDTLSFYLDHQFNELDPETAVETANIQRALRMAGVPINGASPATVECTFYIEVPVTNVNGVYQPAEDSLPVIQAGTVVSTPTGLQFILQENIDFSERDSTGALKATSTIGRVIGKVTTSLLLTRTGVCVSGREETTSFSIGNFVQFRQLTLPDPDITEIIQVYDAAGNVYYEVSDLAEDVVYKSTKNYAKDSQVVQSNLEIVPAPYRFKRAMDVGSRLTTLTFGSGEATSLEDDAIPDPADFAIPLPFNGNFSRTAINPQKLLNTRTLGVATSNTTLTVSYRYGGGLAYNVSENTISVISDLRIQYPKSPSQSVGQAVTDSVEVSNLTPASGGEDAPSISDLKALISSIKNSQERIVTKEDLIARIYTLPSNFGRVYRAGVRPNPDNPLATRLFVVSRDESGKLGKSADTLKVNLSKYLNEYRMVSDAIDILDAPVVDLSLKFRVLIDPKQNSHVVLQNVITRLQSYFDVSKWQIDKPIYISEILNIMLTTNGVISVPEKDAIVFNTRSGVVNGSSYSDFLYDVGSNYIKSKGILVPPEGGIFEIRYPDKDIEGESL